MILFKTLRNRLFGASPPGVAPGPASLALVRGPRTALAIRGTHTAQVAAGTYLGQVVRHRLGGRAVLLFAERLSAGRWRAVDDRCIPLRKHTRALNSLVVLTLGPEQRILTLEDAAGFMVSLLCNLADQERHLQEREHQLLLWEESLVQQRRLSAGDYGDPATVAE